MRGGYAYTVAKKNVCIFIHILTRYFQRVAWLYSGDLKRLNTATRLDAAEKGLNVSGTSNGNCSEEVLIWKPLWRIPGRIDPGKRQIFGMEYSLAIIKADGLDSDR